MSKGNCYRNPPTVVTVVIDGFQTWHEIFAARPEVLSTDKACSYIRFREDAPDETEVCGGCKYFAKAK